jgi:hypothetical protein
MAMGMGGERRTWVRSHAAGPRITSNSDALQAENYLLRQEVLRLRQQLDRRESRPPAAEAWSRRSPVTSGATPAPASAPSPAAANSTPAITADQVRRWGEAMTRHRRWHQLRVGAIAWHSPQGRASAPGRGLKGLIDQLLGAPADTAAAFDQQLQRRWPGLGEHLRGALQGPSSKARLAVRAAFAMLGPAAPARLDHEPLTVVELLIEAIGVLEVEADAAQTQRSWTQHPPRQQAPRERQQDRDQDRAQPQERARDPWGPGRSRRAASGGASRGASQAAPSGPATGADANRRRTTGSGRERPATETAGAGPRGAGPTGAGPTGAGAAGQPGSGSAQADSGQAKSAGGSRRSTDTPPPSGSGDDRRQLAALETLGLAWGASRAAIKAAHRRLVKQHHPDMGGDAESFRLVNDAYQRLIA